MAYRDDVPEAVRVNPLYEMIEGFCITQMISVAAKLEVADLLASGAKSSDELAAQTGTHAASLYRLLRALASIGIFAEDEQGKFRLTPLAEPLQKNVPDSVWGWAVYSGDPQRWLPWGQLMHSVTTGEDAFGHVFGMGNWEYRAQNPAASALFQAAMTSNARRLTAEILDAYDFSGIETIVDVGGGQGTLIAAILGANPNMRGFLFDVPQVVQGAHTILDSAGVAGRCQAVAGDFFESVPPGGDAYILKTVIHDWDDASSATILRNCRNAMTDQARLLLVDRVIRPGNLPDPGRLRDINMLVQNRGGRERTASEFQALLATAGFRMAKIYRTAGELSIVEGVPDGN